MLNSKEFRNSAKFLRNEYDCVGYYNIPKIKKQDIKLDNINLISYSDTYSKENEINKQKGDHFFIDEKRFEGIYSNPEKSFEKLSQYKFLLTIDYSLFREMPRAIQIYNVFRNRWIGAYWQSHGLNVIPCISWSDSQSYEFCFDGIEKGSIVAIGMIGCKNNKVSFMRGYNKMLEVIQPNAIIVFGEPFKEMVGNIIKINYNDSRMVNRNGR